MQIRKLFGVPLHACTMEGAVDRAARTVKGRGRLLIGVVNAAKIVNMRRDPDLRKAVLDADMILADGMSVVWAGRLLGERLPERVAGIDLMTALLSRGNAEGWRVYLLGAKAEVLAETVRRIQRDYPGVTVAGSHHGYFGEDEEPRIVEDICEARPDLLFVAMTSPRKEIFLARWSGRMGVPVCHGVGGAFDVLAGKTKRAPAGWQRLGLEWLYRVMQEPRRMWRRYLVTNLLFCGMVLSQLLWVGGEQGEAGVG